MISKQNPLNIKISEDVKVLLKDDKVHFGDDKGYLTSSLKKFQIGVLSLGEWIGDEILIDKESTHPFSIIAKTPIVTVYVISKEDFFQKLPKEYLQLIRENHLQKQKFYGKRMFEITQVSKGIKQMDEKQGNYVDTQWSIMKQVPNASSLIIKNIGNKTMLAKEKVSKYYFVLFKLNIVLFEKQISQIVL
eukprot:403372888